MFTHKKIDWLRWHKRKTFIRINCFIICAILLIILLLQYPIISNAESTNTFKLSDYWYGSEFLLNEDGPSETGLSRNNVFYNSQYPHATAFKDSSFYSSYGDTIKDIFDNYEFTFPSIGSNEPYNTLDTFITSSSNCYIMTPYVANPTSVYIFITHDGTASSVPYYGSLNASSGFAPSGPSTPLICYTLNLTNGTVSSGSYSSTGGNVPQALSFIYGSDSIYFTANNQDINYLFLNGKSGRGRGGFGGGIDTSILDNDYIGENSFIVPSGSAINNFNLVIGIDLNKSQVQELSSGNYSYQLDITMNATCSLTKGLRNAESQLLADYGLSFPAGTQTATNLNLAFSDTITDKLTSPLIKIPSSVFNDGLITSGGKTAVPFCNYVAQYVDKSGFIDKTDIFPTAVSGMTVGPLSMPTYTRNTNYFKQGNIVYDFSLTVYKGESEITSLPLACTYNVTTGDYNPYSNGGGKSQEQVQTTIQQNNENKTPSDPDYKDPDDYSPSITPSNNDNSSNSNSNSSSSSNPTIYNNATITLPQQQSSYPSTGVMRSFIRIINNDKNDTVDDLTTLTNSNGYIALCNNALSSIPASIWIIWANALKAIFGIIISALFLKILINWAT